MYIFCRELHSLQNIYNIFILKKLKDDDDKFV